jgi:hypothetical protein
MGATICRSAVRLGPEESRHEYSKTIKTGALQILLCQAQGFSPTHKLLIRPQRQEIPGCQRPMIKRLP